MAKKKKIPEVEVYGIVKFKKKVTYKSICPHSYLVIKLNKIVSKNEDYIPRNFGFEIPISKEMYDNLLKQTEEAGGKLKIKLSGNLEFIVKTNDE